METQEKDKSETRESLHTFSPSNHSNLRNFVSSKAQQLQANYLKQNPKAKAKLAALRKSITSLWAQILKPGKSFSKISLKT